MDPNKNVFKYHVTINFNMYIPNTSILITKRLNKTKLYCININRLSTKMLLGKVQQLTEVEKKNIGLIKNSQHIWIYVRRV